MTMYVMEAVNLFVGDDDPTASKHLTISELRLPNLTETMAAHNPGGGMVGIEIGVGIGALSAPFKLNGFDPQVLSQFGLGSRIETNYTAYGSVLDKTDGRHIPTRCLMAGRLASVESDAFQRGQLQAYDYQIQGITHYELFFDGSEKYYYDFLTNEWRVDGVSQVAEINQNLRIG